MSNALEATIARAEQTLPDATWLDLTVHDTAARHLDDIDAAERLGSEINNGGIAAQLAYLSDTGWTTTELDQLTDRLATLATNGHQPW